MKSGSGCPDPWGPPSEERGSAMVERRTGAATGAGTSGRENLRVEPEHKIM
jgi:hypothetical protein